MLILHCVTCSYQKFTRGKDVNRYSAKDLANIFGKRDLSKETHHTTIAELHVPVEEPDEEPIQDEGGLVTIKGGNMDAYFKRKMANINTSEVLDCSTKANYSSESESEQRVGFGFTPAPFEVKRKFVFENPAAGTSSSSASNEAADTSFAFNNPVLDLNDAKASEAPVESLYEVKRTKKRKKKHIYDNPNMECPSIEKASRKRKRGSENHLSDSQIGASESLNSSSVTLGGFDNRGLDVQGNADDETLNGRNYEVPRAGICNRAVNIPGDSRVCLDGTQFEVKRTTSGICNAALDANQVDQVLDGSKFEVIRSSGGVCNAALDISEENEPKRRVTFNDEIEFSTDNGKKLKKKKLKLNKYEIESSRTKKKQRKMNSSATGVTVSGIDNPVLGAELISEEQNDNDINERINEQKERGRRKRRRSNLETIDEVLEEQIVELENESANCQSVNEIKTEETSVTKKSKEKTKKKKKSKEIPVIEIIEEAAQGGNDEIEIVQEISCKKKSKKKSKSLPVDESIVDTSNINKENITVEPEVVEAKKKSKKRKSDTREDSGDTPNNEGVDEQGGSKKKSKQSKKQVEPEINGESESTSVEVSVPEEHQNSSAKKIKMDNHSTPTFSRFSAHRKSKKFLKTLFVQSPILHFQGSNINEIKGYGVK